MSKANRSSRREFLGSAAGSVAVVSLGLTGQVASHAAGVVFHSASDQAMPRLGEASLSFAEDAQILIVDTHQHLWDLDKFRLPWLQGVPKLAKSFTMADYLNATKGLGIDKTVYMEVDVEPA